MDSQELTDWRAWESIHGPLGAERGDYQSAGIAQIFAEVNRDTRKRSDPFKVSEFLVFALPDVEQSSQAIDSEAGILQWVAAIKGHQEAVKRAEAHHG